MVDETVSIESSAEMGNSTKKKTFDFIAGMDREYNSGQDCAIGKKLKN